MRSTIYIVAASSFFLLAMEACQPASKERLRSGIDAFAAPSFVLHPTDTFIFNSFVDCNMAEAWVGDTFRIFSGKYGEDPLWGDARDLKYADGKDADEAFRTAPVNFMEPGLPKNAPVGMPGLHGAVWFETVYQDSKDASGRTLYAIYHNENYPSTLPYDAATGEGYADERWPLGLTDRISPAAVCRIGVMKSGDGGKNWVNKGLFIEDKQPRMVLRPQNTSKTFAGGVGDPSAVTFGEYLYLFYSEYGYPGNYDSVSYDPVTEWKGQCISVARLRLSDLDSPQGRARRWDGAGFTVPWDSTGQPVAALQIPTEEGGGPASAPKAGHYWGPSVSWNTYLNCWVMLMAKATGPSWQGSGVYISFNPNQDLDIGNNSQDWSTPQLVLEKPGHTLWYPALQPMSTTEDVASRRTCLRLDRHARLFFKYSDLGQYVSEYTLEFERQGIRF